MLQIEKKYSTATGKRELPNPELDPEKVKNYEFSIGKMFPQNSSVSIAFYNSYYSNIIQEVRTQKPDGTYTNQNQAIGQANIYGINAFGVWNFNNFTLTANYTYTKPYAINPQQRVMALRTSIVWEMLLKDYALAILQLIWLILQ
jgi:outer membrane receptor protein involved in Fe transport